MLEEKEFEKNSIMVFGIFMIGNVLGAVFQIFSGRVLNNVRLYGELNTLLSLYTVLIWPATVVTYIITKYIAEYNIKNDNSSISLFFRKAVRYMSVVAIIIGICGIIIALITDEILNISGHSLWMLVFLYVSTTFVLAVINGMLQGTKRFILYGSIILIGQATKIIAMLLSLFTEKKLEIIFCVLFLGALLTIGFGLCGINKKLIKGKAPNLNIHYKEMLRYIVSVILANGALTIMGNGDVLFVKHFFNEEAGKYSVAIILGKIITYFAGAIVVVLFPMAVDTQKDGEKARKLLNKSMIYNLVLTVTASLFLNFFSKTIINICYGKTYSAANELVFPVTLMIIPISLLTVIINYLLARNESKEILYFIVFAILFEVVMIFCFHTSIEQIVYLIAIIMWITVVISYLSIINKIKRLGGKYGENG